MIANSTFQTSHEILFERHGHGRMGGGIIADSVGPWLRRLRKEGVQQLRLSLNGCSIDPQVSSTDPWGIISDGDLGVEIWQPLWKKRFGGASDPSPWHVTYGGFRSGRFRVQSPYRPADAVDLLTSAITQSTVAHRLIFDLKSSRTRPYPDTFPFDWPYHLRDVGEMGIRAAALVRSEKWEEALRTRQLTADLHREVSEKLWIAALMALEASVRIGEAAERPTTRSYRHTG